MNYLKGAHPNHWQDYLAAWTSDLVFWAMLRAAADNDVLFAPTTNLGHGTFTHADNAFSFSGALEAYQGYGPYILMDDKGHEKSGYYSAPVEFSDHAVAPNSPRDYVWEQPLYNYGPDGVKGSGITRRFSYRGSGIRIDPFASDSLPYFFTGALTAAISGLKSAGGTGDPRVDAGLYALVPVMAAGTVLQNALILNHVLQVNYVDHRTYLVAGNACHLPPTIPSDLIR